MELIEIKDMYKQYKKGYNTVKAVDGVSLKVAEGEMTAIIGPSGSGKSTLLNLIAGLDFPDSGEYLFAGEPVNFKDQEAFSLFRCRNVGFILQNAAMIDTRTVYNNIILPLEYAALRSRGRKSAGAAEAGSPEGRYSDVSIKDAAQSVAERLGIADSMNAFPSQLSGGQVQRAAIARAIINNPRLLLADEPTGALDKANGDNIMNIFSTLNKEGITVIIVTHDMSVAEKCSRIVSLSDGKLTEGKRV